VTAGEPTAPLSRRAAFLAGLRSLVPYLVAGVLFITIGVIEPHFMLNWSPGLVLLLLVVWVIPALWRRWRER
jgi:hypothetical protein